ncbi:unnamed protein product [Hymenolepis diminuta]|nr:unnamed protein product [Hymenolepis diminuta]
METETCLRVLADRGIIAQVHFNRGIRYVDPRIYQDHGVVLNRPYVSEVLVDVLKHLTRNAGDNKDSSFTASDIEQCLQSAFGNARVSELRDVELLKSLLIEGRHGKLCLLPNGRYLLDEDNHHKGIVERTIDPYDFPILSALLDEPVSPIKYTSATQDSKSTTPTLVPDERQEISSNDSLTSQNVRASMVSEVSHSDSSSSHGSLVVVDMPEQSTNQKLDEPMDLEISLSFSSSTLSPFEDDDMLHGSNLSQNISLNIPSNNQINFPATSNDFQDEPPNPPSTVDAPEEPENISSYCKMTDSFDKNMDF